MFKYKILLATALTLTMSLNVALFYTNPVAAQPNNSQVILGSKKSRPKATPGVSPRCTNNFWECLNLNSVTNSLLRIFSPATPTTREPKPECKNNEWVCPILSPQGNTISSGTVGNKRRTSKTRPLQKLKPECKDSEWACPILSPQGNTNASETSINRQGNTSISKIRLIQEPKPECKDNVWACIILEPLENMSPSQN